MQQDFCKWVTDQGACQHAPVTIMTPFRNWSLTEMMRAWYAASRVAAVPNTTMIVDITMPGYLSSMTAENAPRATPLDAAKMRPVTGAHCGLNMVAIADTSPMIPAILLAPSAAIAEAALPEKICTHVDAAPATATASKMDVFWTAPSTVMMSEPLRPLPPVWYRASCAQSHPYICGTGHVHVRMRQHAGMPAW